MALGSDVLPLGEHRGGEPLDPVQRDAGDPADVLQGLARTDPRLDVTRTQCAFHLDLQLSEPGTVTTNRRPQRSSAAIVSSSPVSVTTIKDLPSGLSPTSRAVAHRLGWLLS